MGLVNGIFTSISSVYNKINPLTFGEANDVIIVKKKNGEYNCSPFYIRFSKLNFCNSRSRLVNVLINGEDSGITMTITSAGDLYFKTSDEKEEYVLSGVPNLSDIVESVLSNALFLKEAKYEKISRRLQINEEYFDKMRRNNLNLRKFFRREVVPISERFDEIFLSCKDLERALNIPEYWELNIKKYKEITKAFEYIFTNEKSINGALKGRIEFSNCLFNQYESISEMEKEFKDFYTTETKHTENLAVRIKGDRSYFYFKYNKFVRLYFETMATKNKKMKILELLEEFHEESLGWSMFRSKQLIKRDLALSMKLNSKEISDLNLKKGKNDAEFKIMGTDSKLACYIYLWDDTDKIVVSDIDGTITKSDILGQMCGYVGFDWTHISVAPLFKNIAENGYRFIYLSSRPIGQSSVTRNYLRNIDQGGFNLPEGPILLNNDGIIAALYKEVISKETDIYKRNMLEMVLGLFPAKRENSDILIGGFGNKLKDVFAYQAVGIKNSRIFTIKPDSKVTLVNSLCTYRSLSHVVDSMFPNLFTAKEVLKLRAYSNAAYWNNL